MSFRTGLWRFARRRVQPNPSHRPLTLPRAVPAHRRFASTAVEGTVPKTPEWFMERFHRAPRIIPKYEVIVTSLPEVKEEYIKSGSTKPAFSDQDILDLLVPICFDKHSGFNEIREAVLSFQNDFNAPVPREAHNVIISSLIRKGKRVEVARWIESLEHLPPYERPTQEHYHMFLDSNLGSFPFHRKIVAKMRDRGILPTWDTYRLLLKALWRDHPVGSLDTPDARSFEWIVKFASKHKIGYDANFADDIQEGFLARNMPEVGEKLLQLYESLAEDSPDDTLDHVSLAKIREASNTSGIDAALREYGAFVANGGRPSVYVLSAIIRHSTKIEDLRAAEEMTGIEATVVHYSNLIHNNCRLKQYSDALSIYYTARDRGVVPNAATVHPLFIGLCGNARTSEKDLDLSLEIYRDLVSSPSERPKDGARIPQVNARIFAILLGAVTSSSNPTKYSATVRDLFADMEKHHVPVSNVVSNTIISLLKSAATADDAFNMYRRFNSKLDEFGYRIILKTFRNLRYGSPIGIPSYPHYLRIISDMRVAGYEITSELYSYAVGTIIGLSRESKDPALVEELSKGVSRIHDHITLDASFTPDVWLLNQFLDAYNRLDMYPDCFRVWDHMYLTGRYNHASVSIILDACGYSRSWPRAQTIAKQLAATGFVFNNNNWHAWVECLCRLDRLNDAVKIVCMHMGEGVDGVQPDETTVDLLLSWARSSSVKDEILRRIHKYKPELWAKLSPRVTARPGLKDTADSDNQP